jgi:hypothetical protein
MSSSWVRSPASPSPAFPLPAPPVVGPPSPFPFHGGWILENFREEMSSSWPCPALSCQPHAPRLPPPRSSCRWAFLSLSLPCAYWQVPTLLLQLIFFFVSVCLPYEIVDKSWRRPAVMILSGPRRSQFAVRVRLDHVRSLVAQRERGLCV